MLPEFRPETYIDFSVPAAREAQAKALTEVENRLGSEYPNRIGGRDVGAESTFTSINPSQPSQVVGVFPRQDASIVGPALEAAEKAFDGWRRTAAQDRASVLLRAANIMRRRRLELNAWEIIETGKPWGEADGDVAEAIDFCEFYAREAIRYGASQPVTPYPGEMGELRYIPLGTGAIIPPWNFPLAILCGMSTAAIAAGNTIIVKPSSDAAAVAAMFMEIMEEAGVPDGVLNMVTGPGSGAGESLVTHPRTRFIAFTGSKRVGLRLNALAAQPQDGQIWIKRAILEMGGKDFTVVDESADLEAAADGIVAGAFGFAGQKCSACSRAIVVESVYDEIVERVAAGAKKLQTGPSRDLANQMGPVINKGAFDKISGYVSRGQQEGRQVAGGGDVSKEGYFIPATVFADVAPSAALAREEIFGPVLAILKAKNFDESIALANDTEYGLTGAVYSRDRAHIAQARQEAHAGNLYINRKCTGALVGVHPFGGFNMSGTDSKAGGGDYLLLFSQAKTIAEKL